MKPMVIMNSKRHALDGETYHRISSQNVKRVMSAIPQAMVLKLDAGDPVTKKMIEHFEGKTARNRTGI